MKLRNPFSPRDQPEAPSPLDPLIECQLIIAQKWQLERKIGSGAFGHVYECVDVQSGRKRAVKMEIFRGKHAGHQLAIENAVYQALQGDNNSRVPRVHWFGTVEVEQKATRLKKLMIVKPKYHCLVMDLMGPSLESLFSLCNRRFSLKTVLQLAEEMLHCVEFCHSRLSLHRDMKPDNFLIRHPSDTSNGSMRVVLVDFGLAKRYVDMRTKSHIPHRERKTIMGTARYISLNTHAGVEPTRRDDLESVGFILMYFLKGSLPWQGLKANDKEEKYEKIFQLKRSIPLHQLCHGYPDEFADFLRYCRSLRFEEGPNYELWRSKFHNVFVKYNFVQDGVFEWSERMPVCLQSQQPPAATMDRPSEAMVRKISTNSTAVVPQNCDKTII